MHLLMESYFVLFCVAILLLPQPVVTPHRALLRVESRITFIASSFCSMVFETSSPTPPPSSVFIGKAFCPWDSDVGDLSGGKSSSWTPPFFKVSNPTTFEDLYLKSVEFADCSKCTESLFEIVFIPGTLEDSRSDDLREVTNLVESTLFIPCALKDFQSDPA